MATPALVDRSATNRAQRATLDRAEDGGWQGDCCEECPQACWPLMLAPVVEGLEREQDWQRHLQHTCESLASPSGHL